MTDLYPRITPRTTPNGTASDAAEVTSPSLTLTRRRKSRWLRFRFYLRAVIRRMPRRLKITRPGGVAVALTLAVGFAAFNTGNNLLFFGWGLLLSSILVSGILSEATLRSVVVHTRAPHELRAQTKNTLPFILENRRKLPAFAVEVHALFLGKAEAARSFELRLDPGQRAAADLAFLPARRGRLVINGVRVLTSFPFGFFEKEMRIRLRHPMALTVFPARLDLGASVRDLLSRLGESPARQVGAGDELFSLRPYRAGDDPRTIAWRRSAKTGRPVVKETEASRSKDVMLELVVPAGISEVDLDHATAVCGSLAEDLLGSGHAVGLIAPGVCITPAHGSRQRSALLTALALVEDDAFGKPQSPPLRTTVVAVLPRGAARPAHAAAVVHAQVVA